MDKTLFLIIQIAVLLFSISVHESAHAWMADRFGDPTAKMMGRITLNPIPHIDLFFSIIFPIIFYFTAGMVFGGAKPVLVNMRNLKNPKKANLYISAAGPISNIIIALISLIIFHLFKAVGFIKLSSILEIGSIAGFFSVLLIFSILINVILAFFNLLPIPPLDGSGIIEGFLKNDALYYYRQIKPYGLIILIALVYFNIINLVLDPIQKFVFYLIYL